MSVVVLDASAILALIAQEPGSDRVAGALDDALLSTVNLAELVGMLRQRGASESDTEAILDELHLEVVPFDRHHAFVAGNLEQIQPNCSRIRRRRKGCSTHRV